MTAAAVIAWNTPPIGDPIPWDQRLQIVNDDTTYANWAEVGQALRRRPNRWALVAIYSTANAALSSATQVRYGRRATTTIGDGPFEAVARTVNGQHRLYARYTGNPDGT
jgi:hypothetical protein